MSRFTAPQSESDQTPLPTSSRFSDTTRGSRWAQAAQPVTSNQLVETAAQAPPLVAQPPTPSNPPPVPLPCPQWAGYLNEADRTPLPSFEFALRQLLVDRDGVLPTSVDDDVVKRVKGRLSTLDQESFLADTHAPLTDDDIAALVFFARCGKRLTALLWGAQLPVKQQVIPMMRLLFGAVVKLKVRKYSSVRLTVANERGELFTPDGSGFANIIQNSDRYFAPGKQIALHPWCVFRVSKVRLDNHANNGKIVFVTDLPAVSLQPFGELADAEEFDVLPIPTASFYAHAFNPAVNSVVVTLVYSEPDSLRHRLLNNLVGDSLTIAPLPVVDGKCIERECATKLSDDMLASFHKRKLWVLRGKLGAGRRVTAKIAARKVIGGPSASCKYNAILELSGSRNLAESLKQQLGIAEAAPSTSQPLTVPELWSLWVSKTVGLDAQNGAVLVLVTDVASGGSGACVADELIVLLQSCQKLATEHFIVTVLDDAAPNLLVEGIPVQTVDVGPLDTVDVTGMLRAAGLDMLPKDVKTFIDVCGTLDSEMNASRVAWLIDAYSNREPPTSGDLGDDGLLERMSLEEWSGCAKLLYAKRFGSTTELTH